MIQGSEFQVHKMAAPIPLTMGAAILAKHLLHAVNRLLRAVNHVVNRAAIPRRHTEAHGRPLEGPTRYALRSLGDDTVTTNRAFDAPVTHEGGVQSQRR